MTGSPLIRCHGCGRKIRKDDESCSGCGVEFDLSDDGEDEAAEALGDVGLELDDDGLLDD